MLAHEVLLGRLILGLRRAPQRVVQQVHDVGESVPEDAAERAEGVHPRPAQLLEGQELVAGDAPRGLLHRPCTDEAEDHADTLAARLDGLKAPQVHGDGLGVGTRLAKVLLDCSLGRREAPRHGCTVGDPVGVKGMDIPPGRQHAGSITQQISAGCWQDVLAVECAQKAVQLLAVAEQEAADRGGLLHHVRGAARRAGAQHLLVARAGAEQL
mmetsp:Transcript_16614/g.52080  ORF Transcript_16614/g.52080 Transcript_16614/m.52080 type:complete len:212 (-) Transcript_16614:188-823(-)